MVSEEVLRASPTNDCGNEIAAAPSRGLGKWSLPEESGSPAGKTLVQVPVAVSKIA